MKKIFYLFASIFTLSSYTASAQSGFDQLIKSSPADATKLVNAYASPLFKGFGLGMNSGWTNTAQTKGLLHFDLRISTTLAYAPTADKTYDVTQLGLSNHLRTAAGSGNIAQTFVGSKNAPSPTMNVYDDNGNKVSSFSLPEAQLGFIPTPQLQLTVGLIKNTDVTVRLIPETKISDDLGTISMFGLGFKHNIAQDFGRAGKLIPFDLAVAFGFNKITYKKDLNVQPESGTQPANAQQSTDFSNQRIEGHFNSFMAQAILSKKLLLFTPFVAVGYNTAKTDIGLLGNYPITSSATLTGPKYTTYTNPVNINKRSISGGRADIGFQLNLAIVRIYASYGIAQQYNMINGGIGFGF